MRDDAITEARSSRRDMLKKAGVGAAIVWASPVVSSVVTPAAAQSTGGSGGTCSNYFQVKYNSANCGASLELLNDNDECLQGAGLTFGTNEVCTGSIADCVGVSCGTNAGVITLALTLPSDASSITGAIKKGDTGCGPHSSDYNIDVTGNVVTFTGPEGGNGWSHVAVAFCSDQCANDLSC